MPDGLWKTTREGITKMTNNEIYFRERIAEAAELVLTFNTKNKKSIVYLKLTDSASGSFQAHLRINDKFVNPKYYDEGSAFVYLTDSFYEEIQKLAGDREVQWNNTGSIGWLTFAGEK